MGFNSTAVEVALVEALTSWGAVYTALFLPAVLMLVNFVVGSCFISEALGSNQHTDASLHTRYRVVGRTCIATVLALLAWEYHVYYFASRAVVDRNRLGVSAAACNPLYVLWDLADAFPMHFAGFHPTYLVDCAWNDAVFLVLYWGFALTYAMTVFSVSQAGRRFGEQVPVDASYCRKCASYVVGMDHHCYLVGNCVGRGNRRLFLTCLCFGVGNLSFLLFWCGAWAFWQSSAVIHFGLVFVIVALVLLTALLVFQLILLVRGVTTLAVWKCSQQTGNSFWSVLLLHPLDNRSAKAKRPSTVAVSLPRQAGST